MKKKRFVWVKWLDASFQNEECTEEQLNPEFIVETAGFLVREDDKTISVGQDWYPSTNSWRHTTHIPKAIVVKVKRYDSPGT